MLEIVACYGSDMTDDALNHRFRRLRAESTIIRAARPEGLDMRDLPVSEALPKAIGAVEKNSTRLPLCVISSLHCSRFHVSSHFAVIHRQHLCVASANIHLLLDISKYFGQSTPDGVQFQFRTIKKDADHIRKVHAAGGDVANCVPTLGGSGGGGGSTSFSSPAVKTPASARSVGSTGRRAKTTGGKKRAAPTSFIKRSDSDIEEEDDDDLNEDSQDWSGKDMDETPSKRVKKEATPRTTPSRRAATKAAATIADSNSRLDSSSDNEVVAAEPPRSSIFGDVPAKEKKTDRRTPDTLAFNDNSIDSYMGPDPHGYGDLSSYMGMMGDGEI